MRDLPQELILRRVAVENPWWDEPTAAASAVVGWTPRPYLDLFFPLVEGRAVRRAAVLMGPRRVGKTVLLHHAIERLLARGVPPRSIAFFSVDHPVYNGLGLEQLLDLFAASTAVDLRGEPTFVFFDEIQYLRDWEIHLKSLVDSFPLVKAIASGSAAAALRLKSAESGAGRFTEFVLPPLGFSEFLALVGQREGVAVPAIEPEGGFFRTADVDRLNELFLEYLNFGGYPEVVLSPEIQRDPGRFVKSDIIDKVLLRDLPSLYGIQDVQELNRLFTTLAFNTANEVSLDALSKGSGVAKNTIKRYIEYLEAAFLLRVVHRVDLAGKRFHRANFFKVYLTNPSMRAALFAPIDADDVAVGALVETAVFAQWFHSDAEPLFYARWKDGEVDLVNVGPGAGQDVRWAVEAKWTDRPLDNPGELKSAVAFCRANDLDQLLVTTRRRTGFREVEGVRVSFVPASEYCYAVSHSLIAGRNGGSSVGPLGPIPAPRS